MKTNLLIIIFSLLFICNAFAQEESNDVSFIVSGKVINPETKEGISFANVNLDDTYWGIICDSLGFFRLRVNPNQKLRISALGFKEQIVDIKTPTVEDEIFQDIVMERESFLLEEVAVYSLGTWKDFKENFIKEDLPEEENIAATFDFGNLNLEQAKANTLRNGGFGFNLSQVGNLVGKIGAKRRARNGEKVMTDWQLRILQTKYNKEIVTDLTHETGIKLDKLMAYINTKVNFTHQTSEMYIGVRIKQLHKEFLESNPSFEDNFTLSDSLGKVFNSLRP